MKQQNVATTANAAKPSGQIMLHRRTRNTAQCHMWQRTILASQPTKKPTFTTCNNNNNTNNKFKLQTADCVLQQKIFACCNNSNIFVAPNRRSLLLHTKLDLHFVMIVCCSGSFVAAVCCIDCACVCSALCCVLPILRL